MEMFSELITRGSIMVVATEPSYCCSGDRGGEQVVIILNLVQLDANQAHNLLKLIVSNR